MQIYTKNEMLWGSGESLEGVSITRQMYALILARSCQYYYLGACQSACQRQPVDSRMVAGRSPAVRTSSLLATINVLATSTYKPRIRTENPCVGGSR